MKTAGQLLSEKRLRLELDLDQVSQKTKIKKEYLIAIEDSDFAKLPSSPVTKGFLKSYAHILHLNPDTLIAMYRRDYDEIMGEIVPHGLIEPVLKKTRRFSVSTMLTTFTILVFLAFLTIQLIRWWSLPKLTILQPLSGETYGESITVKGITDKDASVTVGDQPVVVAPDGSFSLDLKFPAGTHQLIIKSSSRDGKTRLLERTFTISK